MTGYWKFNTSLLDVKGFRDQLLATIQRELTGSVLGNRWWGHLKSVIRSFAADYSRRLNRDRLTAQTAAESRLEVAIQSGDSVQVAVARAELASSLIKKDQALVVSARLKKMSAEATNMATELRQEELRTASDR